MSSRLPSVPARWCLGVATSVWLGVLIGMGHGWAAVVGLICVGVLLAWRLPGVWVLVVFLVLGVGSGWVAQQRVASQASVEFPTGRVEVTVDVVEESSDASWGLAVGEIISIDAARWAGVRVAVRSFGELLVVGSRVVGSGTVTSGARSVRGEPVAGTLTVSEVHSIDGPSGPLFVAGNSVRGAVQTRYDSVDGSDGLIRGFLIGDTDLMRAADEENLRDSGLSHFTAVSGSNVALFLAVWWFFTAPLSMHPRIRVIIGGIGLWLFAIITRWEASVVRASAMAAVPLVGGWFGIPVDPWMALGTAVTALLLVSGHLVAELGFQLSALATAGVLAGIAAARGRRPRWLILPLATTMGAQLAVAPILLITFGTVPLMAPVANLIAAPVVAGTTIAGAAGVAFPPAAHVARVGGSTVVWVADLFADGPQFGWFGVLAAIVMGVLLWLPATRPVAAAVTGLVLLTLVIPRNDWPTVPQVTVLDVGQGDAILIQDPSGASLLMDGGADPRTLERALRRRGVSTVDTVVVSHGDVDHIGGLPELIAARRTNRLLVSEFDREALDIVEQARAALIPVVGLTAGDTITVGSINIDVLGPARRFLSDNDGSVVLMVDAPVRVLLPGDAEAVALSELPLITPDVVMVPHHGSSSTDVDWLLSTNAETAILSYGPNRYGHPHPDILAALSAMQAKVLHTAIDGDIEIELQRTDGG